MSAKPLYSLAELETLPWVEAISYMIADLARDSTTSTMRVLMNRFQRDAAASTSLWFSYLHKTPVINLDDLTYLLSLAQWPNGGLFSNIDTVAHSHARLTDEAYEALLDHVLNPPPGFSYEPDFRLQALFNLITSPRFSLGHSSIQIWFNSLSKNCSNLDIMMGQLLGAWASGLVLASDNWADAEFRAVHLGYLALIEKPSDRRRVFKKVLPHLKPSELKSLLEQLATAAVLAPHRPADLNALLPVLKSHLKNNPHLLAPWFNSSARPVREAAIVVSGKLYTKPKSRKKI